MSIDLAASTATTTFQVRRLSVLLPLLYDRAIERFGELVPAVDLARFGQLANWDAVIEQAEINAPHGFMVYWQADVTAIVAGSGSGWKCTEYLMGNHVIAQPSMMFASLGNPDIAAVGIELDGLVSDLLTALGATVPTELRV